MLGINPNRNFNLFSSLIPNLGTQKVLDIKSTKARNLLRGIDPSSYSKTKLALEKIKKRSSHLDYKKSILYIRTSPIFSGNIIGQLFNHSCPKGLSETLDFSPNLIATQIELYKKELTLIVDCADEILNFLKKNELRLALDSCFKLVELKGASVFLIRLIYFINNRYHYLGIDDKVILKDIDKLKKVIRLSNCGLIEEAAMQLSNLRTSHLAICKRINDLTESAPNNYIVKSFTNPIPRNSEEFIYTLNALFAFSLFDAFLYLQLILRLDLPFVPDIKFINILDTEYEKIASIEFQPIDMYENIDFDSGYYYLRECFLFVEQPKALRFLSVHGYYYSDFSTQLAPTPFAKNLIRRYFLGLTNMEQLRRSEMEHVELNWERYDSNTCGMLENSSALIYLITKKEGHIEDNEQKVFIELMSFSRDIGETCHPDYLECIASIANNHELKLVAQCLISINKKSHYTEHQLRSTIQDYCLECFNGDLNKFLQHLYFVSPAVTEHLILTCNETFLSTLFHLMDKPVDALRVRADMLQWYGEQTKEERYLDRAKTLRIDIQLHKEKGTIDDSRIYVDPLKYSQWFEDNLVNKLTVVLDNVLLNDSQFMKLDWNTKSNSIGNNEIVIDYLLTCYQEFCENKNFGIASYLGRRIRHGTFDGTAITELHKIKNKKEYVRLFDDIDFKKAFEYWLKSYDGMIEELKNTYLHIKSKRKPNGLISTEINSVVKKQVANQLLVDILSSYSKKSGVIRLPSLIIDYCWRLVEHDLIEIKKVLSEKKSTFGVFRYTSTKPNNDLRRQISKFTQEVNSLTAQKFGLIASWFNKPNYASPSTDIYLLFNAVISEVKDSVSDFNPIVDLGERRLFVNGGTYYVIYDALYVLIHNAARHGKRDGIIHFLVSKPADRNAIKINLMSELESIEALRFASSQIEKELIIADENAHIIEGNSGIKKLKNLEHEGSISDVRYDSNEEDILACFEFYFELGNVGKYNDIDS